VSCVVVFSPLWRSGELERGIDDVNRIRNEWQSITSGAAFSRALFEPRAASGGLPPANNSGAGVGVGADVGRVGAGADNNAAVGGGGSLQWPAAGSGGGASGVHFGSGVGGLPRMDAGYRMEDSSHVMPSAEWRPHVGAATPTPDARWSSPSGTPTTVAAVGGARFVATSMNARRQASRAREDAKQREADHAAAQGRQGSS
jgi:hypothetical protein